jgi:hypothetical protein
MRNMTLDRFWLIASLTIVFIVIGFFTVTAENKLPGTMLLFAEIALLIAIYPENNMR